METNFFYHIELAGILCSCKQIVYFLYALWETIFPPPVIQPQTNRETTAPNDLYII